MLSANFRRQQSPHAYNGWHKNKFEWIHVRLSCHCRGLEKFNSFPCENVKEPIPCSVLFKSVNSNWITLEKEQVSLAIKILRFIKSLYKMFTMYTISKCHQCVFMMQSQSNQSSDDDALFGNVAYLHNLYTVVELHTSFVLIRTRRRDSPSDCPAVYPVLI